VLKEKTGDVIWNQVIQDSPSFSLLSKISLLLIHSPSFSLLLSQSFWQKADSYIFPDFVIQISELNIVIHFLAFALLYL
jgi:hypothetical protein